MGDLITLAGSSSKVGRADGPIYVWGPSGTEPRLGTKHFVEGIEEALAWDTAAGHGAINPENMKIVVSEFDFSQTQVVYDENGVKVTAFPVIHALSGAVWLPPRLRRSVVRLLGRHACLLAAGRPAQASTCSFRECSTRPAVAAASGLSIERATSALGMPPIPRRPRPARCLISHTPRVAGLYHTLLSPRSSTWSSWNSAAFMPVPSFRLRT